MNSSDSARRIVVKVGTSTLTDSRGIDRAFVADLAAQLASQRKDGRDVVLVTSGAIRAGRERLEGKQGGSGERTKASPSSSGVQAEDRGKASSFILHPSSLPYKQAAAAVGQGLLMHTYTEAFAWRNVEVAQVLLTRNDLAERHRFLNARNTLTALLSLGVVPIINENDTVAVDEIKFGDNDQLAAHVAVLIEADLLIILSDVEGLCESASGGPVIRTVERIDASVEALAGGSGSGVGTGGMRTKIEAARIATSSGIRTVIARGRRERVIADVVSCDEIGTTFLPQTGRLRGRKRWIAAGSRPKGSVTVNRGAAEKIVSESVSLLPVGIVEVCGDFQSGDLIEVRDESGRRIARGLANYGSEDVALIRGLRSDQIEAALGAKTWDEVIHRDNLVLEG